MKDGRVYIYTVNDLDTRRVMGLDYQILVREAAQEFSSHSAGILYVQYIDPEFMSSVDISLRTCAIC
jgi:hypothetical protein